MGNTMQKPRETDATEEEEHPQEKEVLVFTCEICIESTLLNKKFQNGSLCVHPFCLDCIVKYIEVKVEGIVGNIICPGLNCNHPLDPLSCKPFIAEPIFDKWCDLLYDSAILGSDKCYCPYQDCSVLVLNECREDLKKTECPNCKKSFCFRCKIPWHAGYRCSESGELRDRNDLLVGELIEENKWTRCYNCGQSVERVSGCRIMKCKCGVLFCHECGRRCHMGPCSRTSRRYNCCCEFIFLFCFLIVLAVLSFKYAFFLVNLIPSMK